MAIKWVPDLIAPLAVAAANVATDSMVPQYSKVVNGVLAVGGYVAGYFMRPGTGEQFVKNVGIAATPALAKDLYDYIKTKIGTKTTVSTTFRRVAPRAAVNSGAVSRTYEPEFNKAGTL